MFPDYVLLMIRNKYATSASSFHSMQGHEEPNESRDSRKEQ